MIKLFLDERLFSSVNVLVGNSFGESVIECIVEVSFLMKGIRQGSQELENDSRPLRQINRSYFKLNCSPSKLHFSDAHLLTDFEPEPLTDVRPVHNHPLFADVDDLAGPVNRDL